MTQHSIQVVGKSSIERDGNDGGTHGPGIGLSVSGLPQSATATFNPTSMAGSGSSALTVSTATSTPTGSYPLTITGSSGNLNHTTTVSLVVGTPAATGPTVSSVAPGAGTNAGGTSVRITGTGFLSGATVSFGGTAATNVSVVSSTSITATTPAHAPGQVNVTVTNPNGQSGTLVSAFNYRKN